MTSSVNVKPSTQRLLECILFDTLPAVQSCRVDFGMQSLKDPQGAHAQSVFAALQWAHRHETVTCSELDDALGDGPTLTAIVNRVDKFGVMNPHACTIETVYDNLSIEEDE